MKNIQNSVDCIESTKNAEMLFLKVSKKETSILMMFVGVMLVITGAVLSLMGLNSLRGIANFIVTALTKQEINLDLVLVKSFLLYLTGSAVLIDFGTVLLVGVPVILSIVLKMFVAFCGKTGIKASCDKYLALYFHKTDIGDVCKDILKSIFGEEMITEMLKPLF